MQKTQESKIKMARATSGILEGFEEIVTRTPGLNAAHIALENLISETKRHNQGQMNKGTEFTAKKKESRLALIPGILKICAALAAWGTVSNDPKTRILKEKYQIADSIVKTMRDMRCSRMLMRFMAMLYLTLHFLNPLQQPPRLLN